MYIKILLRNKFYIAVLKTNKKCGVRVQLNEHWCNKINPFCTDIGIWSFLNLLLNTYFTKSNDGIKCYFVSFKILKMEYKILNASKTSPMPVKVFFVCARFFFIPIKV